MLYLGIEKLGNYLILITKESKFPQRRGESTLMKTRQKIKLTINGIEQEILVTPDTPLLWVLRDYFQLNGTKFGCGMAQCGACTVQLDGNAIPSCVTPISAVAEREIVTIEGLSEQNEMHPVQRAWMELDVPQCGYCQAGQMISAAALLNRKPHPSDRDIDMAMSGNICRCGTYLRIRAGIYLAAKFMEEQLKLQKHAT